MFWYRSLIHARCISTNKTHYEASIKWAGTGLKDWDRSPMKKVERGDDEGLDFGRTDILIRYTQYEDEAWPYLGFASGHVTFF